MILVSLCMLHALIHQAFPFLVSSSSRKVLLVQNNSVPVLTRGFLFVSQIRTHRCLSMVRCYLALQTLFLLLRPFKQLGFLFFLNFGSVLEGTFFGPVALPSLPV